MKIKVGINGMGRIGRMIIRSIIENKKSKLEIKHINNRTSSEACSSLLKYDSIHGRFNAKISFDQKHLILNNKKITFSQETDLKRLTGRSLMLIMFLSVPVNSIIKKSCYLIYIMEQKKL